MEAIDQKARADDWKAAATKAGTLQRELAVAKAKKAAAAARLARWLLTPKGQPDPAKKLADAEAALAKAEAALKMPPRPDLHPAKRD